MQLSIKAKNFKSIGSLEQGFEEIFPINVIIGRNNAGKSTLLDLIHYIVKPYDIYPMGHKGNTPEVYLTKSLSSEHIASVFPSNVSGGNIRINHREYGMKWLDKPLTIRLMPNNDKKFYKIVPDLEPGSEYKEKLGKVFPNDFAGKIFRRIRADRDINPEGDGQIDVLENGVGATNIIQNFYNKEHLDRTIVTKNLLNALNDIFSPDLIFNEIIVRQKPNGTWEVFLNEEGKGFISLSNSGSGLKTVILVLVNLLLVPNHIHEPISKYIFAFEELENNLHPGLQRKLFNYIRNLAIEQDAIFFLTTHSNVVIDLFNKDRSSQIVHVTHDGISSSAHRVFTYIENKGILDDLDIRASDLLQSNGIVWVEGPSDRLYFNRWIDIWSEGQLKEGTHYQCVFYGGRLLAHINALQDDGIEENGVNILKVNSNAILLVDSDRDKENDEINKTKKRIIEEIESAKGYTWITAGREVENYIPSEALSTTFHDSNFTDISLYDKFQDYLNNRQQGTGDQYLKNKVLFAENIIPNINKENIIRIFDMEKRLIEVCEIIKSWNSTTKIKTS